MQDIVDEWRDMIARYRQWLGRRVEAAAVERAITDGRDPEEVRMRLLASNSIVNDSNSKVVNVQHGAGNQRRRRDAED